MSTTIDSKVVEMRFDNQQFERGVQTSMNTLGNLKKSLDMNGATKGLENISAAAGKIDLSSIGRAIEPVQAKFSALEAMAVGALMNIGRRVEMTAEKMAKSLTVEPIITGFKEYETQINAVQTILANTKSKGTTIDDVNGALDELNTYADKTIYNFTEMTRNIGTFTAAGVDLDKSVTSIKGIANLAAMSGSSSQQASTAMYQLSQALAAGKVSLMDWNSVVNAGMGGEVFQNALKRTAENMGTNVDAMIKKYGSFRESLTQGEWLTAEVLTETLTQLSGAYSKADLIAQGYSEKQATEILELAQTAEDSATKVKTFTQLWDTLKESAQSGWSQTWEIIVGDFEEAKELLTKVSDVLGNMIGKSAEARNKLVQGWKDAGGRDKLIEGLSNAFEGLLSVIRPIRDAFKSVFPPITVNTLMTITDNFVKFTESMHLTKDEMIDLKRTFRGVFAIFDIIGQAIFAVGDAIKPLLGDMDGLGETVLGVTGNWGDWLYNLSESMRETNFFGNLIQKIVDGFKDVVAFISPAIEGVKKFFSFVGTYIAMPGLEIVQALLSGIQSRIGTVGQAASDLKGAVTSAFEAIKAKLQDVGFYEWLEKVKEGAKSFGAWAAGGLSTIFTGLIDAFSGGDFSFIFDAINTLFAGGITVAITKFLKSITDTFKGLTDFKDGIVNVFDGVKGCMEAWQTDLKANVLGKIATAILILAGALVILSLLDSKKLGISLGLVTGLFADLMGSMAIFGKVSGKMDGVGKALGAMIGIAVAVLIMAGALAELSTLPIDGLGVAIGGLVAITGALVGAVILISKFGNEGIKGAVGIVIFAAAIKIVAGVCADLAQLNWEELGRGLAGLAGILLAVTLAVNFMPKNLIGIGVGLIAVSAALLIMSSAISNMGGMTWDEVGRGLAVMGGAIAILAVGLNFMKGAVAGAAALVIAAAALAIMTPVLVVLGAMSWTAIATGLITIAAAFAVIGIAGLLLQPIVPAILALAAAFALIGVAVLSVGAGLLAVGTAFTIVASGLVLLSTLAPGAINIIVLALTSIVTAIAGLIPIVITKIGEGIIAFCGVIAEGAPAIGEAIKAVLRAVLNVFVEMIPEYLAGLGVLLDALFNFALEYIPKAVEVGMELLLSLLHGIESNIAEITETALNIIAEFLNGIGEGIDDVIQSGIDLMIDFINGMADGIRDNHDDVIAAVNNLMDAVIEAVVAYFENAKEKGGELLTKVKEGISSVKEDLKTAGKDAIQGFIDGISSKLSNAWSAASKVGESALNGIKNMLGIQSPSKEFAAVGRFSGEGLIQGLVKYSSKVGKVASGIGDTALTAMRGAIGHIADVVNGEVESPTIRPVLDLSAVRAGASSIGNLFNTDSTVGVLANVRSASAMMSGSGQNGGNGDIVSAINGLRKDLSSMDHATYNVNGVTYDDGSNITNAVQTLVRAAKIERRV